MNWNRLPQIALLTVGLTGYAFAQSSTPPTDTTSINATGKWKGECDRCAATGFTLVLSHVGTALTGTIKTEGTPTFGDSVKPILNTKVSGNKLEFQARGDAGDIFNVELTAARDGKGLNGTGCYRGGCFGLRFSPASP